MTRQKANQPTMRTQARRHTCAAGCVGMLVLHIGDHRIDQPFHRGDAAHACRQRTEPARLAASSDKLRHQPRGHVFQAASTRRPNAVAS